MSLRLVRFAFQTLTQRKFRTLLSIFAVMVGTILITIMVSLGIGLQELVVEKLRSVPTLSTITVVSKQEENNTVLQGSAGSKVKLLNNEAKKEIEQIKFVKKVHPVVQFYALLSEREGEERNESFQIVLGIDDEQAQKINLLAGVNFIGRSKAVLVAPHLKDYFDFAYPERMIGKNIALKVKKENNKFFNFRIVGVIDKKNSLDNFAIMMSLEEALNFLGSSLGMKNFSKDPLYDRLQVEVISFDKTEEVVKQIRALGFEAITLEEVIKQVVKYFRFFELGLGVFGFIVLGVASLGIMNMMIMSIYERTREIGVLKAVGARASDVVKIFSLEAGLIGLMGGIGGVLISFLGIIALERLANIWFKEYGGITETIHLFSLPLWLAFIIILFTTLVGLLSGLYPAIRAARMDPVKALREE